MIHFAAWLFVWAAQILLALVVTVIWFAIAYIVFNEIREIVRAFTNKNEGNYS